MSRTWTTADLPAFGRGWEAFVCAERIESSGGRVSHRPRRYADLPVRPALLFPEGVGYREAVGAHFAARHKGRALPEEAELVAPLPEGVVVELRGDGRIALDPSAPLGFIPATGEVLSPSFTMPDLGYDEMRARFEEQRREGLALPRGAELLIEPLESSQVIVAETVRHLWPDGRGGPAKEGPGSPEALPPGQPPPV